MRPADTHTHIRMHMLLHSHSPVSGVSSGVVFAVLLTRLAGLGSAAPVKVKPAVMEQLQQTEESL